MSKPEYIAICHPEACEELRRWNRLSWFPGGLPVEWAHFNETAKRFFRHQAMVKRLNKSAPGPGSLPQSPSGAR